MTSGPRHGRTLECSSVWCSSPADPLIVWGADWFTDGAIRTAAVTAVSPFSVGLLVSGLEPENLTTGLIAALERLPQIALGTVIGSAIFLLTAALGVTLLLVPMAIRIPRAATRAMLVSAGAFALSSGMAT